MNFLKQLLHSALATFAIVVIVCFLMLAGVLPYNDDVFGKFLIGAGLLCLGQAIFLSAIDGSIIKTGKLLGNTLMKEKKVWAIILFGFLFGFVVTLAEPDVQILVGEIVNISPFLSTWLLLSFVSIGCGLFVCFGLFRIVRNISIKWVLLVLYGIVIALCFFVPNTYVGMAFDAGGVTTGSVTVPFILALAIGICAIRGQNSKDDTFGVIAIASVGPIIAILILGLIVGTPATGLTRTVELSPFLDTLLSSGKSVLLAFLPLLLIFLLSQFTILKLSKRQVARILIGYLISAFGLIVFLTGIYFGFSAMGYFIGQTITTASTAFIILFGAMIGVFFVFTDPSLVVLTEQVEDITNGILRKRVVFITLGLGIAFAVATAFLTILFQVNLMYIFIPLYGLALILNIFIPKMFTALAFDSGGIASGIMTVAFVFPICIGMCESLHLDLVQSSFGVVGIVATIPILAVQILGVIYALKQKRIKKSKKEEEEKLNEEN